MALGHPKKRFDGIGADRQADMIEPEGRGGLQFVIKIGSKLLTQTDEGMVSMSGSHWARLSCESPLLLRIFWHSSRPRASARKRLMRALQAGN